MHYSFLENAEINSDHYLDAEESRHLVQVLRMKEGDEFGILNGRGKLFKAEVFDPNKRSCGIKITELIREQELNENLVSIAVAPTKNISRTEWLVEKCTEIGLREMQFLQTSHSERTKIRIDRIERIAQSAVKQSVALYSPEIKEIQSINSWINSVDSEKNKFIAVVREGLPLLKDEAVKGESCWVLIGPEGDFSKEEVELAEEHGFKAVSLGDKRLRVETAALAACFTINLINQ